MNKWMMTWQILSTVATAVAAVAAWRAANSARRAADATLALKFLGDYSADDMRVALRALSEWRHQHGDDFARVWIAALKIENPKAIEVDRARRQVQSYFWNLLRLHEHKLIARRALEAAACMDGAQVLFRVVEPLEREINPAVDLSKFHELRRLCEGKIASGLFGPLPNGRKQERP